VIQFALLFGLGFLSATLIAILVAPAVHRRIVRYTENRIMATLPISPSELRAQRDMARAVYAAENARTRQELIQARDSNTELRLKADRLSETLRSLEGEKLDLKMQVDNLDTEAAGSRTRLREEDSYIQELKATLEQSGEQAAARDAENTDLNQRLLRGTTDADNLRIDLSSRDAELENAKSRLGNLRDEREVLRTEIRALTTRAKDAEARATQEEQRAARLDERLAQEIAEGADKAEALERRGQELARIRDKLKLATTEAREASRVMRNALAGQQPATAQAAKRKAAVGASGAVEDAHIEEPAPEVVPTPSTASPKPTEEPTPAMAVLAEEARNRATALSERLLKSKGSANDDALREELAIIAASLVAVTAAAEGKSSPIRTILSGKSGNSDRESLSARASKVIADLG
jgi:chromosome segregation ATPase